MPISLIHISFLKQLLGVGAQSSTAEILIETGNVPLSLYAQKACMKNWDRIALKGTCNKLVQISYKNSVDSHLVWPYRIQTCLSSIGLQNIFLFGNDSHQNTENIFFAR